jgi:hypothetical protein
MCPLTAAEVSKDVTASRRSGMHSVGRLAARSGTLTDGLDCKQIAESVARSVCGLVRTHDGVE